VAATRPSRRLVATLCILVAVVTVGGYAWVGSPRLLAVEPEALQSAMSSSTSAPTHEALAAGEAIAAALHDRATKHPNDPGAWFAWARAELDLGRPAAAAEGYRRALALRPKDADLLADAADVFAVAAQGRLEGEPMQLIDRSLAINPDQVKALALKGSYAITQHDFATALAAWQHVLKVAPPGDPIAAYVGRELEALRAAAMRMAPDAQAAMAATPASSAPSAKQR